LVCTLSGLKDNYTDMVVLVCTLNGLKEENTGVGIRWYLSNPDITTYVSYVTVHDTFCSWVDQE